MSIQNSQLDTFEEMGELVLRFEKEENLEEFYTKVASNELRETEKIKNEALLKLKTMILG